MSQEMNEPEEQVQGLLVHLFQLEDLEHSPDRILELVLVLVLVPRLVGEVEVAILEILQLLQRLEVQMS
jgi:hypothetical protein